MAETVVCVGNARVEGLLGVQELPAPWDGWIALIYLGAHVSGTVRPDDSETDAASYYSLSDLNALTEPMEPWSEWLVRRVFAGDDQIDVPRETVRPFPDLDVVDPLAVVDHRFGHDRALVVASIATGTVLGLTAVVPTYALLVTARVAAGLSAPGTSVAAFGVAAVESSGERRGTQS